MERQQLEYSKRVSGLIFFVCLLSTWSILKEFTHYLHKYHLVTKSSQLPFITHYLLYISIFTAVCILTSFSQRHFLQRAILIPEQRIILLTCLRSARNNCWSCKRRWTRFLLFPLPMEKCHVVCSFSWTVFPFEIVQLPARWKEDNEKTMKIIMKKIMKMIMLKSSSCLLGGKIRSPRLR